MDSPQSKGGHARRDALSGSERREIAKIAAKARWTVRGDTTNLPRATHTGDLKIGDLTIPCAVLDNGKRVLSQRGISSALGRARGGLRHSASPTEGGEQMPGFLAANNLKPFISKELMAAITEPELYLPKHGGRSAFGLEASILPQVCDVWLRARDAGVLQKQQYGIAERADILIRGLARVGVVALIDEATGYQQDRDRDELHRLLALYLSEERLAWAKRFPDEFYRQLYRLRRWTWPAGHARPPLIGKITNKIVYERLPQGVLEELRHRNPAEPGTGRRKWKHHQFLSEDLGQPDLRDHLLQLVAVMRVSKDWASFERNLAAAFPEPSSQMGPDLQES